MLRCSGRMLAYTERVKRAIEMQSTLVLHGLRTVLAAVDLWNWMSHSRSVAAYLSHFIFVAMVGKAHASTCLLLLPCCTMVLKQKNQKRTL